MTSPAESATFGNSLSLRVDGAIGAMSLSPNGRDAVLAGRRGLFIIDLDDPFTTPRWLHHVTSWEVADVQWSPHNQVKPGWCISTSNQKALLWDLARPSNNAILNVLHCHTRAITDINFHPSNPEVLATCSVDTFIYSWDMRSPRKPVASWADWRAGAIQVKWNHEDPFQLASSHDNCFYVWDSRKGSTPLIKVNNAHSRKINGLDFSQGSSNIITSSNDNTVKMWNLKASAAREVIDTFNYFDNNATLEPSVVIHTQYPVARARHIPFGTDKACGIMPLRGGEDAVHIVNYDSAYQAALDTKETQHINGQSIRSFKGHKGPMKDFLWRTRHEEYDGFDSKNKWKDYQLVTWSSQDYDLKLWPHDEDLYTKVNYNPSYRKLLTFEDDSDTDDARSQASGQSQFSTRTEATSYSYDTFCIEPPVSLDDLTRRSNGDVLSAMASYQISERKRNNGSQNQQNQINHLDWISGVRVGKADHGEGVPSDENEPTNFGEEVSIVGHKFPKVRFEKISVSTGELVISLRGPLPVIEDAVVDEPASSDKESAKDTNSVDGDEQSNATTVTSIKEESKDQSLIFIRILITFPKSYPYCDEISSEVPMSAKKLVRLQKQNLINFNIEETHELTSAVRSEMLKNLDEISVFYTNKHKKFCLEPCLRYLIGDKIDLSEELMMEKSEEIADVEVGNEGWADDLFDQQPPQDYKDTMKDDSSGEEEDLIPTADNSSQIKSETPVEEVPKRTFFDSTPVPKGCGATWSPTGQLVCFFIPKATEEDENKSVQKFNIFKFTDGGFSLKTHHHQHHFDTSESEDTDASEVDSDASSSSDFSITNDLDEVFEDHAASKLPGFKGSAGLRYGNDKSGLTSGGTASNYKSSLPDLKKKRSENKKNKNIVGIFDFRHLLPDKYELGSEYRVLGDAPECLARHNSEVAKKYGLKEIRDVWKILEMILIKDVIIDDINPSQYPSHERPGTDIAFTDLLNNFESKQTSRKNFRFYWGTHPIGHSWLIMEIFKYFERSGNIQMLAMLSCILYENPSNFKKDHNDLYVKSPGDFNIPIHTPYQVVPSPVVAMRKSNEKPVRTPDQLYSFQDEVGSLRDRSDQNKVDEYLSQSLRHSSLSMLRRDQMQNSGMIQYARSTTSSIGSFKDAIGSPERYNLKKGVQNNFMTSSDYVLSSSNDMFREKNTKSRTKSSVSDKRKLTKGSIGPGSGIFSVVTNGNGNAAAGGSRGRNRLRPVPVISVDMQNTDELDLFDDVYSSSLLQSQDSLKIKSYREQYANMLYMWGLPINRIKILKFNYPSSVKSSSIFDVHSINFGMRSRKKQSHSQLFINAVTSIPTGNNAWNTTKRSQFKYCVLCNLVVSKNMVLCTNCEHVLHTDCASEWWCASNTELECASGCGCTCLDHAI